MLNKEIFEITRGDYKGFIERLVKGAVRTEEKIIDENTSQINVISKKTNKLLCARECSPSGEKYYIFEFPDDDEWTRPSPHMCVVLETPEEVQAVLDGIKKMKENKDGRII